MGEIAEMMLDGTLCAGCGVFLNGDGDGFPRYCTDCQRPSSYKPTRCKRETREKVSCPTCKKRVNAVGLADHMRDAHGVKGYGQPEKSAKTEVPAIVFFPSGSLGEDVEEVSKAFGVDANTLEQMVK